MEDYTETTPQALRFRFMSAATSPKTLHLCIKGKSFKTRPHLRARFGVWILGWMNLLLLGLIDSKSTKCLCRLI